LKTTRDRSALGDEVATVQMAFALRRATDMEREVAEQLSSHNRQRAREIKSQQIALLEEAYNAGQHMESTQGAGGKELELLTAVLERARQVAARLEDEQEDEELMARQCWQDRDDFSCASMCDLRARSNSSPDANDVADLRDFANFSPASSRSNSPASSRSFEAPRHVNVTSSASPTNRGCFGFRRSLARMLHRPARV